MSDQQTNGNTTLDYGSLPTDKKTTRTQETSATEESEYTSVGVRSSRDPPSNEYVLNVAFLSFVGFMGVQAFFALVANSESMLADSEAMSVDALTYLFNMCAERIKNRPPTVEELELPLAVREYRVEMKRLYLELVPPLISVFTLIMVTINTIKVASETLFGDAEGEGGDVSAGLMLFFSGLNLVLDMVNVTCFARAHQAYGLQKTSEAPALNGAFFERHSDEAQSLVERDEQATGLTLMQGSSTALSGHATHDDYLESWFGEVNLNMCSAWTHICADTMRSTAVLVAAGIAFAFDSVSASMADSWAAVAVSVTILLSLIPLLRGLFVTARQIIVQSKNKPAFIVES